MLFRLGTVRPRGLRIEGLEMGKSDVVCNE
jgi:hypothetical protein